MSGVLSDAAEKLHEVAEKISSIDLSDEQADAAGIISAAAATLGEIEASIRGFVAQVGDEQSLPAEVSVENAEPAEESAE